MGWGGKYQNFYFIVNLDNYPFLHPSKDEVKGLLQNLKILYVNLSKISVGKKRWSGGFLVLVPILYPSQLGSQT